MVFYYCNDKIDIETNSFIKLTLKHEQIIISICVRHKGKVIFKNRQREEYILGGGGVLCYVLWGKPPVCSIEYFILAFIIRGSQPQAATQQNTEPDEKNILDEGEWGANP